MAENYTPTEQEIKDVWVMGGAPFTSPRERAIQFDARLAKVRAEAKAEALREAAIEMRHILRFRTLGGPSDEWLVARAASIEQTEAE